MSRELKARRGYLLWISGTLFLLGALAAALLLIFWRRPLGPALGLPTPTPYALATGAEPGWAKLMQATPILQPPPAPAAQPLCGGPQSMKILGIGTDYRYENYLYGLSDVIKIVRVDFVTPRVMLMDLPRDLYVEIPEIAAHGGITHGKLNQAYLYGNPGLGYFDGPGEGAGLLARTIALNYGISPDHYLAVNMQVFPKIVDAVGGVDVSLQEWTLGYRPGTHHLNGGQALDFARARPDGTFDRSRRQDLILAGLWDRMSQPAIIGHAVCSLYEALRACGSRVAAHHITAVPTNARI